MITVSLISHNHCNILKENILFLLSCKHISKVILTINTPEFIPNFLISKKILIIRNPKPKGFGTNHNYAFKFCKTNFFCILNPDINITSFNFAHLLTHLYKKNIAVVSPLIKNGKYFDAVRKKITIQDLFNRFLKKNNSINYSNKNLPSSYWIIGAFMLFKSSVFKELNGFDEKYFLYCEDADLCHRISLKGYNILVDNSVLVDHLASRASKRSFFYFMIHFLSLVRYFSNYGFFNEKL